MSDERKTQHATRQALMQYSLGELTDEQMAEMEDHIAECDTCAARSAAMHRAAAIFDGLPERIAAAPELIGIAERVWAALSGARQVVSGVLGVVGLHIQEPEPSLSADAYRGLAEGSSPLAEFAAAGATVRTRGSVRARGTSVGVPRTRVPGRAKMEAGGQQGRPKCVIEAVAGGEVTVRLEQWAAGDPLPVCVIMPERPGSGLAPQVAGWVREGSSLVARKEIARGSYIVVIVVPGRP